LAAAGANLTGTQRKTIYGCLARRRQDNDLPGEPKGNDMRARTITGVVSGIIAGLAFPAAAGAAPAGNGASVVVQQNGVTTHRICGGQDIFLTASGFAPNRKTLSVTLQQVPGGVIGTAQIPLTAGSGTVDIGRDIVPLTYKLRVRFETGSSEHAADNGSFSADLVLCG
jgi:hypothetical protein